MLKYVVALLCGFSITGSAYLAGWGSEQGSLTDSDACCAPAKISGAPKMTNVSHVGMIDVGNTKCVVMAKDVSDLTVAYQGKVYHICCDDCIDTFNKDPEKYVKALEADPAKFGVPQK